MIEIEGNTVVALTMKQVITGIGALVLLGLGGIWAILNFTVGGLREDVGHIRNSIESLQASERDDALRIRDAENKFSLQMADLGNKITLLSVKMDAVNASVTVLSAKLDEAQKQPSILDPKYAAFFVDQLKKAGLDDQKVIIVPMMVR
jgi:hypothetical protein